MTTITAKTITKQLTGSYAGGLAAALIAAAIVGGSAVFCGTQLGWKNLLTIILLAASAFCVLLVLILMGKMAAVKSHPTFRKYGSPDELARRINQGLSSPRYLAKALMGNAPFATLITEDFIVSGVELTSFMELKDIVTVKAAGFSNYHRIVVGDPMLTAASAAANKLGDRYLESRGVNSQTQFDQLIMKDTNGREHYYGVQHKDMENVLTALSQDAPHIKFVQ